MKQYSWEVWVDIVGENTIHPCILTEHNQPLQNAFWINKDLILIQGSFSGEIKRGRDYGRS